MKRVKRGWMNLCVATIIRETPDCLTLLLVDNDEGGRVFDYTAGQYLTFRFDALGPKPLVRSYTLSSSPLQQDFIAITIKKTSNGHISHYLTEEVKVGDILRARGPMGKFCYFPASDAPHLLMVAAGSGVTPFLAIMREYAQRLGEAECPQQLTLISGFRQREDIIGAELFKEWEHIPGIKIVICLSQEKNPEFHHGRIERDFLENVLPRDLSGITFMSCGPEGLMQTTKAFLEKKGVAAERIHTESFAS